MPRYLTVEQVKDYVRNEKPTTDDDFITAAIDAAEMTLDQACARRFAVAGSATARVYVPSVFSSLLRIHDCTTVTEVRENGALVPASQYQLEPLNQLDWSGEALPIYGVRRNLGYAWYIDGDRATVSVTATWGWAAIPARIEQAALIIAKEILVNRDEVKLGLVGFSDVGGVTARTNPIVKETIAHYKRSEAWGIA